MGTIRKTVTFTTQQGEWIKAQSSSGDFTNDSEYLRDLVRRDQQRSGKFMALKHAIDEGLDSGVSDKTVAEIWDEVEGRYPKEPLIYSE